jgi:hypothetical protein
MLPELPLNGFKQPDLGYAMLVHPGPQKDISVEHSKVNRGKANKAWRVAVP